MTLVKANITTLRSVASDLAILATAVENQYNTLTSQASGLFISTQSLSQVLTYVQCLADESAFASAKADLIEIISSTGGKMTPPSGEVSFNTSGPEPTTLAEAKTQLGHAIAHLAQELAVNDYEDGDPRAARLHDYLNRWDTDQHRDVLATMYDTLGPDGTLAIVDRVGRHVDRHGNLGSKESDLAKDTLERLRTGLHRASTTWNDQHAKTFGSQLVHYATDFKDDSPYNHTFSRLEALAWLLYDTKDANGAMVQGTAEKMDEAEKNSHEPLNWQIPVPRHFLEWMVDTEKAPWFGNMSSVMMHALADHPKYSCHFFSSDKDRSSRWTRDQMYYDGDLSGVSAALDAASTDPTVRRQYPKEAAAAASYALEGLASLQDFGNDLGQHEPIVSGTLEHILETYPGSIVYAYSHKKAKQVPGVAEVITLPQGGTTTNAPLFTRNALDKAVALIGRDGPSLLKLRAAVNQFEADSLPEGSSQKQLTASTNKWGMVEGAIAKALGNSAIDQAAQKDDYALTWIELGRKGAGELASILTSFAPPGADKVAGWGADALVEHFASEARSTWADNENTARIDQDNLALHAVEEYTLRMFFKADELGLNNYQKPGSSITLENWQNYHLAGAAVSSSEGYRFINQEEYNNLPPDKQEDAKNALLSLATSADGFDQDGITLNAFDTAFISHFEENN